jgi:hypothetical protein
VSVSVPGHHLTISHMRRVAELLKFFSSLGPARRVVACCFIVLVSVNSCFDSHPLHPSYEELSQRGFYVYILPKDEAEHRGWLQEVEIWSWDRHCRGVEVAETYNPIEVFYHTETREAKFAITIGPWSMAWDHRKPTQEVKLNTPWISGNTAVFYRSADREDDDYIHLRFEDRFGIPVQVVSSLSITEVVRLINGIEYVGPSPEAVANPWDYSRCR